MQVSPPLDLAEHGQQFILIQADADPNELFVLSLGLHPTVSAAIENNYGFWIQNGCVDGRWHIWTADGAFQGDRELTQVYHYDLIVPQVAFDLRGSKLIDITPECKQYFDRRIEAVRAKLKRKQITAFRNGSIRDEFLTEEVKGEVLFMALGYLYTARDAEANKVLHEMWPPGDAERVWRWMLRKRSEGVLASLDKASKQR